MFYDKQKVITSTVPYSAIINSFTRTAVQTNIFTKENSKTPSVLVLSLLSIKIYLSVKLLLTISLIKHIMVLRIGRR